MKTYTLTSMDGLNGISLGAINGKRVFTSYPELIEFCVDQTTRGLALLGAIDIKEDEMVNFLKMGLVALVIEENK